MSGDVDVVRGLYADEYRVWGAAVLDHMCEHVWAPDIGWRAIEGAPDDVGPMHGRDALRRYYEEWLEMFDDLTIEARDIFAVGDRVVAVVHVAARARSTDMPLELDYACLYEVRDGRVARGREFHRREEAVAAAEQETAESRTP